MSLEWSNSSMRGHCCHAIERKVEGFGQDCRLGQGMAFLEPQRPVHDARREVGRRRLIAFVEDRREAPGPPVRRLLRVGKQARGRRFVQTTAVVHQILAQAAGNSLPGSELQLARRVITGMADHATPLEDRLHIGTVGQSADRSAWSIEARRIGLAELLVERLPGECRTAAQHDDGEQHQRLLDGQTSVLRFAQPWRDPRDGSNRKNPKDTDFRGPGASPQSHFLSNGRHARSRHRETRIKGVTRALRSADPDS